jgi:hypothetical protein
METLANDPCTVARNQFLRSHRVEIKEDLSIPLIVTPPEVKAPNLQEADDSYNSYVLRQRESHGRRTVLRLAFDVYGRKNGKTFSFNRLRNRHLLISLPNGDQAEAFMRTIEQVCKAMDGKFLAVK